MTGADYLLNHWPAVLVVAVALVAVAVCWSVFSGRNATRDRWRRAIFALCSGRAWPDGGDVQELRRLVKLSGVGHVSKVVLDLDCANAITDGRIDSGDAMDRIARVVGERVNGDPVRTANNWVFRYEKKD